MIISEPDRKALVHYLSHFDDRLRFLERQREKLAGSYLSLRTLIGLLGMALPLVVSFGALVFHQTGLQTSISAYYHTDMRDFLVGILWAVGLFLFSYQGYEPIDAAAAKFACFCAICVAVFPTAPDGATEPGVIFTGQIHLVFAALLFVTLTGFCFLLFTKTDPSQPPSRRKLQRNMIYRVSGAVMFTSILLMVIYHLLPPELTVTLAAFKPVYWLESLAIFAFGISWFVKGEGILKDEA